MSVTIIIFTYRGNKTVNIIRDTEWLRQSFLHASKESADRSGFRRGAGFTKFQDTTLGGNTAINAPYQFTHYADIKEERLIPNIGRGMGRWYSENIDDFGHNVHFRMGVPAYNNVISYAMTAVDAATARYAATGQEPGFFAITGNVAGILFSVAFWEISVIGLFASFLKSFGNTRFYYIKPTMYQYWRTVQTLVDTISANLGLTPRAMITSNLSRYDNKSDGTNDYNANKDGDEFIQPDDEQSSLPSEWLYTVDGKGTFNVHAIARRAEALNVRFQQLMQDKLEGRGSLKTVDEVRSKLIEYMASTPGLMTSTNYLNPTLTNATLKEYINSMNKLPGNNQNTATGDTGTASQQISDKVSSNINTQLSAYTNTKRQEKEAAQSGQATQTSEEAAANKEKEEKGFFTETANSITNWVKNTFDSFGNWIGKYRGAAGNALYAELRDGSQWISFRVSNAIDSVSESVSSSLDTTNVMDWYNQASDSVSSTMFSFGIGPNAQTGNAVQEAISTAATMMTDLLSSTVASSPALSFANPLIGLLYGAKIENPKRWGSSSTSLSSTQFNIELRAAYGNQFSYMQDIIIPLACLMAMSFPRGTGPQSYGAPFYVQYYSRGRSQVAIGMVSSISITRGVGAAPWTKAGLPLGVDVSFSITDTSEMLYVPAYQHGLFENGIMSMIEENAMGDYLNVLAGVGLAEQEYISPKLQKRFTALINSFTNLKTPSTWAAMARASGPGDLISKFFNATAVRN